MRAQYEHQRRRRKRGREEPSTPADNVASSDPPSSSTVAETRPSDGWVFFVPYDTPKSPLLVNKALLAQYECRSALLIEHEAPNTYIEGRPAWYRNAPAEVLKVFFEALEHHEFVVPRKVELGAVVRYFDSEGISLPKQVHQAAGCGADEDEAGTIAASSAVLAPPPPCLASWLGTYDPHERVTKIARQVVCALLKWPRLWHGLVDAQAGRRPGFAVTASRVWVRFASRSDAVSHELDLRANNLNTAWMDNPAVERQPPWLVRSLRTLGQMHLKLVRDEWASNGGSASRAPDALKPFYMPKAHVDKMLEKRGPNAFLGFHAKVYGDDKEGYVVSDAGVGGQVALFMKKFAASKGAFDTLSNASLAGDALCGPFFAVEGDAASAKADEKADVPEVRDLEAMLRHQKRFATEVIKRVWKGRGLGVCPFEEFFDINGPELSLLSYSRLCLRLAVRLARETPDCSVFFDGRCAPVVPPGAVPAVGGNTPERRILEKELQREGIKVVAWSESLPRDHVPPLTFPPSFYSRASADVDGPCALLEISKPK